MNNIIVFHKNCLDGFCAAYAAWRKFGDDAEYVPYNYSDEPDLQSFTDKDVYIVDFSFQTDVTKEICTVANHVTVIDHHITAEQELKSIEQENFTFLFDIGKCGSMLTWLTLIDDQPPEFFTFVNDNDLGIWEFSDTRYLVAYLYYFGWDYENIIESFKRFDNCICRLSINGMVDRGYDIYESRKKDIKKLISKDKINFIRINEQVVPCVNAQVSMATDGCKMLMEFCSSDVAGFYQILNDKVIFSLRSTDVIDCSEISKSMGGGGHKKASGFTVNHEQFVNLLLNNWN